MKPEFPTELTEEEIRNINKFTLEIVEKNEAAEEKQKEINEIDDFFSSILDEMLQPKNETENEEMEEADETEGGTLIEVTSEEKPEKRGGTGEVYI